MPPRKLMHDWMIAPAYGPGLQFERIAINSGALCVECKACGRRSALTAENCPHIRLEAALVGSLVIAQLSRVA